MASAAVPREDGVSQVSVCVNIVKGYTSHNETEHVLARTYGTIRVYAVPHHRHLFCVVVEGELKQRLEQAHDAKVIFQSPVTMSEQPNESVDVYILYDDDDSSARIQELQGAVRTAEAKQHDAEQKRTTAEMNLRKALKVVLRMKARQDAQDGLLLVTELVKIIGSSLARISATELNITNYSTGYVALSRQGERGTFQLKYYPETKDEPERKPLTTAVEQKVEQTVRKHLYLDLRTYTNIAQKVILARNEFAHRVDSRFKDIREFNNVMDELKQIPGPHQQAFACARFLLQYAMHIRHTREIADVFPKSFWQEF